jgi:DNA-binding transcriptional regulator YiaG
MENQENGAARNVVLAVRRAVGETQPTFAKRLGVGLRSLKRYELENVIPRNLAVRRTLHSLAKKHGIEIEETAGAA